MEYKQRFSVENLVLTT